MAPIIPNSKNNTHRKPAFPLLGPCYLLMALQNILLVLYPFTTPVTINIKDLRNSL